VRYAYAILEEKLRTMPGVLVHVVQVDAPQALTSVLADKPLNIKVTHCTVRRAWCMGKCSQPHHRMPGGGHDCKLFDDARLFIRERDRRAA
jgi:hypothetical protein